MNYPKQSSIKKICVLIKENDEFIELINKLNKENDFIMTKNLIA